MDELDCYQRSRFLHAADAADRSLGGDDSQGQVSWADVGGKSEATKCCGKAGYTDFNVGFSASQDCAGF